MQVHLPEVQRLVSESSALLEDPQALAADSRVVHLELEVQSLAEVVRSTSLTTLRSCGYTLPVVALLFHLAGFVPPTVAQIFDLVSQLHVESLEIHCMSIFGTS